MERLNLNIPADARKILRSLARSSDRTEGEYARELLLRAIKQAKRAEFYRRAAEVAKNPEWRKRDLEITEALERLRG